MLFAIRARSAAGFVVALSLAALPVSAATTQIVGVAPRFPNENIVENAVNSTDHTKLVAAVTAVGLVDTLVSPGPFTVFASTNKAFGELLEGTVETLVIPENKNTLTAILAYRVALAQLTEKELMAQVREGGGKAELQTVQGETLTVMKASRGFAITDAKGDVARVTIPNVMQSNGVIHVIDTVLLSAG